MARIRSIHPSLFTDEAWVSCSPLARVLYIGLLTDADDQGLFEWKPLQIRMRLLPGDNADVSALLEELAGANLIATLESAGKKLGAIRKFRRFQRPKKPNRIFVLPIEWGTYVGLSDDSSEPDDDEAGSGTEPEPVKPARVPKKAELAKQMEEGGGRSNSVPEGRGAASAPPDPNAEAWKRGRALLKAKCGLSDAKSGDFIGKLLSEFKLEGRDMLPAIIKAETLTDEPRAYLRKCAEWIAKRRGTDAAPSPEDRVASWGAETWDAAVQAFHDNGKWSDPMGPRPDQPGCKAPESVLAKHGYHRSAA